MKTLKYAAVPVLIVVFLALYPQINLWVSKGASWQGAYFVSNYDEVAYSAYIHALMEGKPRKYDPYLAVESPHESLYSIQFVPAYAIAIPARFLGSSTSTAFIILALLSALFSALIIFLLLYRMTGEYDLSATGVLVICCLGTAAAYQGELRSLLEGRVLVDYLPFLRRYQPAFAFPLFFLFCGTTWLSLGAKTAMRAVTFSILSGTLFALLVFSYFYLWTAAAGWLGCVYLLTLFWNHPGRKYLFVNAAIVGLGAAAALIPYFSMLAGRSPNVDSVQLLTNTHWPNLASPSLIIGLVVICGTAVIVRRGTVKMASPLTIFTLAFAAAPFVFFNQQVVTGRSLQPVHYEIFIANYIALTSVVLLISLVVANNDNRIVRRKALLYMAIISTTWGVVEAAGSTRRNGPFADLRDISVPVLRLIETAERNKPANEPGSVVLATNFVTSDFVPTVGTLRPLWSSHSSSAGGLSSEENKRLFYGFLFYSGFTDSDLAEALRANSFEVTAAIFGSERALPALAQGSAPISMQEIGAETRIFADFVKSFDRESAASPSLSYVIAPADGDTDFTNLDRWYERDAGTDAGLFRLYRVRLR